MLTIGIPILHQKPGKNLFLHKGLMVAPCSWNMLPWWYVYILTMKWSDSLNNSRILKLSGRGLWDCPIPRPEEF
jgi:hypothetical protein